MGRRVGRRGLTSFHLIWVICASLTRAVAFAKSEAANYLPGWCAPHGKPALAAAKVAAAKTDAGKTDAGKTGVSKAHAGKAQAGKTGAGKNGKKSGKSKGGVKMRPDAQPAPAD